MIDFENRELADFLFFVYNSVDILPEGGIVIFIVVLWNRDLLAFITGLGRICDLLGKI